MDVLRTRPAFGERYKEPQARAQFWEHVVFCLLSHCQVLKQQASPVVCQSTGGGAISSPPGRSQSSGGASASGQLCCYRPTLFPRMEIPASRPQFQRSHTQSGERVVIVNEELVRSYWPGQNPLGSSCGSEAKALGAQS